MGQCHYKEAGAEARSIPGTFGGEIRTLNQKLGIIPHFGWNILQNFFDSVSLPCVNESWLHVDSCYTFPHLTSYTRCGEWVTHSVSDLGLGICSPQSGSV